MNQNAIMVGTAVGTVIGLPIVAQYTITQWKAKKTLMWIAGGISTAALASASYWYLTQYGKQTFAGEGHRHYDPKTKSFHAPAPPSTSGRAGVWKGPGGDENNPRVSGAGMSYNPSDYNLKTVFDMQKGQYRHIGTDRVTKITIGGRTYNTTSAR